MESTLSLGYVQFANSASYFLGYGASYTGLGADKLTQVDAMIQAGYRQGLYPPGLPDPITGQPQARHTWSFLKPTTMLTTIAGADAQDLPDDFGGMDGNMTFASSQTLATAVRVTSESAIRDARQGRSTSDTAIPYLAAIRPKPSDGSSGQRFEILFYPTPDAAYELSYRYNALQAALTVTRPYPLGGMVHSEMFMASILAMCDLRQNDTRGLHWEAFMERLAASVAHDRSIRQPEYFGYCGDGSDALDVGASRNRFVSVSYVPVP